MKQLYFHFNNGEITPHTYCVEKTKEGYLAVGYAVAHPNDQFCRKTGRKISLTKLHFLETHNPIDDVNVRIHKAVEQTLPYVVARASKILNIESDPITIKILVDYDYVAGALRDHKKVAFLKKFNKQELLEVQPAGDPK